MIRAVDVSGLAAQVHGGVAVVVAVCDAELRPEIGRGWGPRLAADGSRLTLCVSADPGSPFASGLVPGAAMAVTLSRPSTYRSVQLKGRVEHVAAPDPDQLELVEEHVRDFCAEVEPLGLPDAGRLRRHDLVAVTLEVRERYDQTPGPNAGARL